jgi:hydroxyethylthiazole kinase-like uncharacterized protein yjeF
MRALDALLADHPLPDGTGGKDERGALVIIGGPATCPGAAVLAGEAALRSGCGRVQLVVDPTVAPHIGVAVPEALVLGVDVTTILPDHVAERIVQADAVLVGPGHQGGLEPTVRAVAALIGDRRLVLDAGALSAVGRMTLPAGLVLAPNTHEASDLAGMDGAESALAEAVSARHQCPVAVRGQRTSIVGDGGCWSFEDPPPGLGTPGSGDVFMGVLGALLSQGMPAVGALGWAVALHAQAGALLASATPSGYLARDLVHRLPEARARLVPTTAS